jgi:hypothetical protein
MIARVSPVLLWITVLACGGDPAPRAQTAPPPAPPPSAAPPVAVEPAQDQPALVAEALDWLDRWTAAQTAGDTPERATRVRVSLGQVRTWLDGATGLAQPLCEITFVQSSSLGERREHGHKRLLVRREGPSDFRIVEEEMIEREEGLDFSAMPDEPFQVKVSAGPTALEVHASDPRETEDGARVSRTLLTVRAPRSITSLHLDSDLALGEPAWEGEGAFVLSSSPHAGRLVMFRLVRQGETLTVDKRYRDEGEEPEPWTAYARIALGVAAPVPLRCTGSGEALSPCIAAHPTL